MNRSSLLAGLALGMLAPSVATAAKPAPAPLANCTAALLMTVDKPFLDYLDCRGAYLGNIPGDVNAPVEEAMLKAFGGEWAYDWNWVGKTGSPTNPFTANPPVDATPTTLTFISPITGRFVIGIKQSTFFSFYLYNATGPVSSIVLDSRGTADGRSGFSHVNLYTTSTTAVPEPATVLLMGTGLLGLGLSARRRRK